MTCYLYRDLYHVDKRKLVLNAPRYLKVVPSHEDITWIFAGDFKGFKYLLIASTDNKSVTFGQ